MIWLPYTLLLLIFPCYFIALSRRRQSSQPGLVQAGSSFRCRRALSS